MRIIVDKDKSISKGLTVAQVFMQISSHLASASAVTTLRVGNTDYEIFIKDQEDQENITRSEIMDFSVSSIA